MIHLDLIAEEKAVLPSLEVLSGEAPMERRKETILSDAFRAATVRGALVAGTCSETKKMYHGGYFLKLADDDV